MKRAGGQSAERTYACKNCIIKQDRVLSDNISRNKIYLTGAERGIEYEMIITHIADERICPGAARKRVITSISHQGITGSPAKDAVIAIAARQAIPAVTTRK